MLVSVEGLRAGANTSHVARDRAKEAAGRLSDAAVAPGIFGDFAAALSFQRSVSDVQADQVALLTSHHQQLGEIGDKAHLAASAFTETEECNAATLRAVGSTAP